MTYEEIENLLFIPETNEFVLDGDYYTDPFFATVDHRVCDMFLFYTADGDHAVIYGYVIIDSKTKKIVEVNENVEKSIRMPNDDADNEIYKRLYEQVHEFVFAEDLTAAQSEILKEYYILLQSADFSFYRDVYNTFIPEFSAWAKRQLSL